MSQPAPNRRPTAVWPAACVTLLLTAGASTLAVWLVLAFDPADVEAVESPLVLPVARQLADGPWTLYGPFGGANPLVLIHAPLYYHLAALGAWPLAKLGMDTITAALAAGRCLSGIGLLVTLAAVYHLARLGGESARTGWWAACLAAATPIYGGIAFAVRPDMLGIGVQTTGILLVSRALAAKWPPESLIVAACACFGVAIGIKQLYVVAPFLSAGLLLTAAKNGRLRPIVLVSSLGLGAVIVAVVFGVEQWQTAGQASRALFTAALGVKRVHPAGWPFVGNIFLALLWKCAGLVLLGTSAGIVLLGTHTGRGRRLLAAASTALVVVIVGLESGQLYVARMAVSAGIVAGEVLLVMLVVPAVALWERRPKLGDQIDRALGLYVIGELVFMGILCRQSTGAWYNYAIEAVVIGSAIVARVVARAFAASSGARPLLPAVLAALAVPLFAVTDAKEIVARRSADRALVAGVLAQVRQPRREIFFVDRPGDNRTHGRPDLVYDAWLYPVFETIGLAEPRSIWLARALSTGPVRVVIGTGPSARIEGVTQSLPELGYRPVARAGPLLVWER